VERQYEAPDPRIVYQKAIFSGEAIRRPTTGSGDGALLSWDVPQLPGRPPRAGLMNRPIRGVHPPPIRPDRESIEAYLKFFRSSL
jgi:hypothetical protein